MTKKNFHLLFNIAIIFLLVSCGKSPTAQAPVSLPPAPITPSFTQPMYRLGDTLEFSIQLVNNEARPRITAVNLNLLGTYRPGLPVALQSVPASVWLKTQQETLEPGEKRTLTYQILPDVYSAIGTGDYELRVEALGHSAIAGTVVTSVFIVEATYPSPLQVGQTVAIQAVMTNMASFDVHDVKVSGSMHGMDEQTFDTLPAYGSTTITWTLLVPNIDAFDPEILIKSSNGGNATISPPSVPIAPVPTP